MSITSQSPTTDPPMVRIKAITLREQVYDQLRQAIMDKRLKPGDHVREQGLTATLGVSRTPLREALGLLERDGLVQNFPNRGWFVTTFSPDEIKDIFVIRSGLETLAVEQMIGCLTETEFAEFDLRIAEQRVVIEQGDPILRGKIDMAFHERIVALAGNSRLLEMWRNIAIQCAMAFNYHTVTIPNYDHMQGVRDHTAILNALRSGNVDNVRAVNNQINSRVARQCIEGVLAVESRL